MVRKPPIRTRWKTEDRQAAFLMVHLAGGPDRTLRSTRDFAIRTDFPQAPSLSTLRRWSARYGWEQKAERFDAERMEQATDRSIEDMLTIDARHARDGKRLQELALAALEADNLILPPGAAVRAFAEGVKAERVASGMATERVELLAGFVNTLIEISIGVFTETLGAAPPGGISPEALVFVRETFAQGMDDQIARRVLPQLGMATEIEG